MFSLVLEMKVMVKEATKFSSDVEYPENAKDSNDGSAQVRLPQELFEKYKGRDFFLTGHAKGLFIDCKIYIVLVVLCTHVF